MSSIQSKINRYVKKQENVIQNQENNQSVETDSERTEIMGFGDKDFKIITMDMLLKDLKESINIMNRKIQHNKKK